MALPLYLVQHVRGQEPPLIEGDCDDEPAVAMFLDWRFGRTVYPSVSESGPQVDWIPFRHPSLPVPYLIPPGWEGIAAWADSFTRAGEPIWQDSPMALPQLTLARLVAPDGDAVFEYAVGSIQQQLLTTQESAQIGKMSMLGDDPDLEQVCLIDDQGNQLAPGWFTVDIHKRDLLITFGNATVLPHDIAPATIVSFTSLYGPRRDMETLMYDAFLRILFQFLGSGSGDPTPTPTVG